MTTIDLHSKGLKGLTEKQFMEAVKKGAPEFESRNVKLSRSYFNLDEGRSFCVCDTPSIEAVREAHERAGIPTDEVIPVKTWG